MSPCFLPSAARADSLREAMGASWRQSLTRSLQTRPGQASFPTATPPAGWAPSALDFGAYFDLCLVVPDGEPARLEPVGEVAFRWLQQRFAKPAPTKQSGPPPLETELKVTTLSELFYSSAEIARFERWLDMDAERPLALEGIGASRLMVSTRELRLAWQTLGAVTPALRDEIAIISPEVVLARSGEAEGGGFDGVSSFCLWGCMVLNTGTHHDSWDYFCGLMHESAHNLLFALARNEPLVLNPIEALFDSPLRDEPRPMDGIFHAAFVSAREVYALRHAVAHTGELPGDSLDRQRTGLRERLSVSEAAFWAADKTLQRHGQLSPLGASVLQELRSHMALSPLGKAALQPPADERRAQSVY